ncbi:hypothetical protein BDV18DRAFT_158848 [Aspergillus unguis]
MVSSGASASTASRSKKTGIKGTKGKKKSGDKAAKKEKKTGKKTGVGKKKTSSSSTTVLSDPVHPRPPPPVANPYNTPTYPPYSPQPVFYSEKQPYGKKRKSSVCALSFLVVIAYLAVIALGGFVISGCVSTKANANDIYLAELNSTGSSDITLRVGYFGGCVSVTSDDEQSASTNSSSSKTICVGNMRTKDIEDLAESFAEDLTEEFSVSLGLDTLQSTLNNTLLPRAKNMQSNVFFWPPPLLHLVFFVITGIMLFVIRIAGSSQKRAYKGMVVFTIVLCGFTLSLALVSVLGALQGLNALLDGSVSKDESDLGDGLYIHRGELMHGLQAAVVAVAALFYVLMGALFVLRTPEAAVGVIMQAFQNASRPLRNGMKRKRRGGF